MLKISCVSFFALLTSATLAQNANQAAVDTLTKDVAKAVFANINQPKAQEIYAQLQNCSAGCDPQQVIRGVGSWDQVGAKMQELSELKNTQRFQAMSPEEANAAIRKQLAQFYKTHKAEKPYSVPLSPVIQAQILAKIDGLLPPAELAAPTATASDTLAPTQPTVGDEEADTSSPAPAGNLGKNSQDKQFWMILISFFAGLLGGAAAIYFLLYRESKAEATRLRFENSQLSRSLDLAQRTNKPTNERRQPQDVDRQKANAYDVILAELGTDIDPLTAIQQLKQQTSGTTSINKPGRVQMSEPAFEPTSPPEPSPVQIQNQVRPPSVAPISEPTQPPIRSEVFYCPPPDPNGQFDITQKTDTLLPESAYRFNVSANNPAVASFRFEAEPGRVARFITYRNYMIEPACESENSYSATHTRIVMRRDGEASFENGVWRVKTKAVIRYE